MVIINFILFQIAWFACVLGAANAMPWLGVGVTAIIIWHLYQAKQAKLEAFLMLIALIIAASFDQVMLSSNLIEYAHHGWSASIVPVWILALWLGFVTALNVSLRWMHDRKLVAILFGAIGGPLAYWSAAKLGAVTLLSMNSYIALSIGWAVITPLLLLISARLDGFKVDALEADKSAQPKIGEST
ncbi:MAG: DUF2878 domain-containing protein [Methylotenera sp.]